MKITRNTEETAKGPADWFTGEVYIAGQTTSTDLPSVTVASGGVAACAVARPRARPATISRARVDDEAAE